MGMGMGIRRRMGLAEREGRHGQGEFKKQEPSWFQLPASSFSSRSRLSLSEAARPGNGTQGGRLVGVDMQRRRRRRDRMTMIGSRWKSDAAAGGTQDALHSTGAGAGDGSLRGLGPGAWRLVGSGLAARGKQRALGRLRFSPSILAFDSRSSGSHRLRGAAPPCARDMEMSNSPPV